MVWWMTFTSAPGSTRDLLRAHFQVWRKRLGRHLGCDPAAISYVMVDTHEGHGVLHAVVAFPVGVAAWLDFSSLGDWWLEIHGARQVKFKKVGGGDGDVRRLSTYLIAQYMVSQGESVDLLGRVSASRSVLPLSAWRRYVWRVCGSRLHVYEQMHALPAMAGEDFERLWRELRRLQFRRLRACWDQLLDVGWFEWDGIKHAAFGRSIFAV
jgi:hypothetical protein